MSNQLSSSTGHHNIATQDAQAHIEVIVRRNVESGRFTRVQKYHDGALTEEEYTQIVTQHYLEQHSMIALLRQGDGQTWELLTQRLYRAATSLLRQRGWDGEQAEERAQEVVQDTALIIFEHPFPYDCPFDAWSFLILRNRVAGALSRPNPLNNPHNVLPDETEDSLELAELPDIRSIERSLWVLEALEQVDSEAQRRVIEYEFLEGLPVVEIAERLGRTPQAVYNLKNRALRALYEIIAERQRR
ncbi:MAG: RNA polymerase sigma factor [Anaerolineae bacterium]